MESRTNTTKEESKKQAEIRRQIAALQALLKATPVPPATPPKRKQMEGPRVIAAGTPSPKNRKLNAKPLAERPRFSANTPLLLGKSKSTPHHTESAALADRPPPKPSKLLSDLASLHVHSKKLTTQPVARSVCFTEKPVNPGSIASMQCQERDERLVLIETLLPGPRDHKAPVDDPHFERLEPNSGIHLSSRKLGHIDLQEHLRGRYYLSPSLMYSVIRPLPSNQGYDVPVPGDWLTIAVVAERGPIKLTSTSSSAGHDDEDVQPNTGSAKGKGNQKTNEESKNSCGGKKYISFKLVDFGTRSLSGAKLQIRGDALLTLLLFEADSYSYIEYETRPNWSKAERTKVYKGGSGGAFEACMKLHEGAVIAILNPKILKPYQRNATAPHPTDNILAITPTSAQSIAIIGRSRDLVTCVAVKRDGKPCGSWCDKRVSEYCEYHVEYAVKRNRAGRAEFSIGTSGMTAGAPVRKPAFDPERKWGLLPATNGSAKGSGFDEGGSTYVMPGHVISAYGPQYVGEKIGREREERAKRRRADKKAEEMLNRLLGREGGGNGDRDPAAGAVRKAREVMNSLKGKGITPPRDSVKEGRKSAYSAETIQRLGFDPTIKRGHSCDADDAAIKRKLEALESLQRNRGVIELGHRPGRRVRSCVSVPEGASSTIAAGAEHADPDDGLETEERLLSDAVPNAVSENSDDDLVIEPPL